MLRLMLMVVADAGRRRRTITGGQAPDSAPVDRADGGPSQGRERRRRRRNRRGR